MGSYVVSESLGVSGEVGVLRSTRQNEVLEEGARREGLWAKFGSVSVNNEIGAITAIFHTNKKNSPFPGKEEMKKPRALGAPCWPPGPSPFHFCGVRGSPPRGQLCRV